MSPTRRTISTFATRILALAISSNPEIREFARTMIRDHTAVNEQALALLAELNAEAQDNFLSQALTENAEKLIGRNEPVARRGVRQALCGK